MMGGCPRAGGIVVLRKCLAAPSRPGVLSTSPRAYPSLRFISPCRAREVSGAWAPVARASVRASGARLPCTRCRACHHVQQQLGRPRPGLEGRMPVGARRVRSRSHKRKARSRAVASSQCSPLRACPASMRPGSGCAHDARCRTRPALAALVPRRRPRYEHKREMGRFR